MILLNSLGALFTLFLGLLAIFQPQRMQKLIALTPYNQRGWTEIRATYGGWIVGLSGFTLALQNELLYDCLGVGWLGAGIVRIISMQFLDKSYSKTNLRIIIIELVVGLLLLL